MAKYVSEKPKHAVTIHTYREFREDVRRFAAGKFNFLIVIGTAGLGKTETVKEEVESYVEFSGGCPTPIDFYSKLWVNQNAFVILDDVNQKFYSNHTTNSYLKILTNTRPDKTLQWHTSTLNENTEPPNEFTTSSRVVLLANQWESLNEHVIAIESRAYSIIFDPTPAEVHHEVAKWFTDQEVYDFVWEHRGLIITPDMRLYGKILEQKNAGAPWQKRGLEMMIGNEKWQSVAGLLTDISLKSNHQRCERFVELGYGSRSTFYEVLRQFRFYKQADPKQAPPKLRPTRCLPYPKPCSP